MPAVCPVRQTLAGLILCLAVLAAGACTTTVARGGSYINLVRPDLRPPLVGQAVKADSLWGPREGSSARDGIADSRRAELQALVERFAPTLVLPRNDFVQVADRRFRLIPTNARLFADTLRLDVIRAGPFLFEDTLDIALQSPATSADSLVALVDAALLYNSDPDLIANAYFDFPGASAREWWQAYGRLRTGPDSARWARPTVYAHPFIEGRGKLAIQYWFFYPFNDFVGNHEGDWEHITVVTTADHQRVEEVHYYFHQRSLILPQDTYRPEVVDRTHPVSYVGGRMYHLPDYPIRLFAGERNEGPHGNYPYPGEWEGVAGLGAPESVQPVKGDSSRVVAHHQFDVILTPEPSRIDYRRRPEVLREWGWLLLPVRWGFPVSTSVLSELNMDVGNRGPFGPAFHVAWNRTAPGMLYPAYRVRRIPKLQSFLEDLLQPWYYPYIFRTPRYIHDTRDSLPHRVLEGLGLVPKSGWAERSLSMTALGLSFANPSGAFADAYRRTSGALIFRSFWASLRIGKAELGTGYARFAGGPDSVGVLYLYPVTLGFVATGPGARWRPHIGAGGGVYGWQSRTPETSGGSYTAASGWEWGWNAQVGLEYYMRPNVALDLRMRWHWTRLDGAAAGLASDDLRFTSFLIGHYIRF